MVFVMKCSMMNILERFTISEMQTTVSLVLRLKEVYVTPDGIETKKDYAKFFLIRKTRLQQYQSDLSWKKVQMSLLDIMR